MTDDAKNIYRWLDWIISENLSFEFADKETNRKYSNLPTLRKYVLLLSEKVKEEIRRLRPSSFGIIFDGWSLDTEHYLVIFATWTDESSSSEVVQRRLLSCACQADVGENEV